ncbi:hypothetical protein EJ06DRAFT_54115 [Trichodelitschia bisporula]|uniref:Uncharacterized protein n=1 Tax=Trichodelitschia bisporula TaxID=703511 RepID=A0A6G1HU11_9PEZI|nr:hypothetical protein EJ06DRAFT_54115 [Trichodelitschia bisporula]
MSVSHVFADGCWGRVPVCTRPSARSMTMRASGTRKEAFKLSVVMAGIFISSVLQQQPDAEHDDSKETTRLSWGRLAFFPLRTAVSGYLLPKRCRCVGMGERMMTPSLAELRSSHSTNE